MGQIMLCGKTDDCGDAGGSNCFPTLPAEEEAEEEEDDEDEEDDEASAIFVAPFPFAVCAAVAKTH